MDYLPSLTYPEGEKPKLARLETLFLARHQHLAPIGSASEQN